VSQAGAGAGPRPGLTVWWVGARPRTLGAGLVPVLVGAAAAGHLVWWRLGAAVVVAAGLQVGVNFANDYFDGVKGIDTHERAGPARLTQTGAATPRQVKVAALLSLLAAGFAGLALALATTPVLIFPIGALALAAALLYSGGPKPYAGMGLGELMVFAFFGIMATCGTAYVMVGTVPASAWWAGSVMGLLSVAILVANNLRDIPTDGASGKLTLAVRLGEARTRNLYRACVVGAFVTIVAGMLVYMLSHKVGLTQWGLFGLAAWPLAIRPLESVGKARGRELVPVLTGTAAMHAACGLAMALGLALSHTVGSVAVHV
jgi:1,4-dihydroxy-2-naphthoate polyprenyltransferase